MSRIGSGIGAIAFAALTVAAFVVGDMPGGNYSASDVADYLASGHQLAVFVSLYLALVAAVSVVVLFSGLREAIADNRLRRVFFGSGIGAAAALGIGWCLAAAPPLALTFGSAARPIDPKLVYVVMEAGLVVVLGAGGFLLGVALLALVAGSRGTLPGWVRAATAIGAVAGITSLAFFPSFLVPVWALAIGVWLLVRPAGAEVTRTARPQEA